jgi:hypothetical protein
LSSTSIDSPFHGTKHCTCPPCKQVGCREELCDTEFTIRLEGLVNSLTYRLYRLLWNEVIVKLDNGYLWLCNGYPQLYVGYPFYLSELLIPYKLTAINDIFSTGMTFLFPSISTVIDSLLASVIIPSITMSSNVTLTRLSSSNSR